VNVTDVPTGCGATRSAPRLVKVSTPPVDVNPYDDVDPDDDVDVDDVDEAFDTGNEMLPFDAELSYVSAVLPAFLIHTPIRYAENASVGVQVQELLVDQPVCWYHSAPSKIHHLY
jgi:hypothetical protein